MKRILVVEDDPDIARLLELHLGDHGFRVDHAATGPDGLRKATTDAYDLVVLDIMLPGMDGFEVCRKIRETDRQMPIMVLSARTEEFDKVLGLELGADAYVTKPFGVRELVARIKAMFRRIEVDREASEQSSDLALGFDGLSVDPRSRTASIDGAPVELTAKEFDLLLAFIRSPGRAFSRQELLELVWGYDYPGYSHTVNSHINRLRRKIESDPAKPEFIQTVWGIGYRFGRQPEG